MKTFVNLAPEQAPTEAGTYVVFTDTDICRNQQVWRNSRTGHLFKVVGHKKYGDQYVNQLLSQSDHEAGIKPGDEFDYLWADSIKRTKSKK